MSLTQKCTVSIPPRVAGVCPPTVFFFFLKGGQCVCDNGVFHPGYKREKNKQKTDLVTIPTINGVPVDLLRGWFHNPSPPYLPQVYVQKDIYGSDRTYRINMSSRWTFSVQKMTAPLNVLRWWRWIHPPFWLPQFKAVSLFPNLFTGILLSTARILSCSWVLRQRTFALMTGRFAWVSRLSVVPPPRPCDAVMKQNTNMLKLQHGGHHWWLASAAPFGGDLVQFILEEPAFVCSVMFNPFTHVQSCLRCFRSDPPPPETTGGSPHVLRA